MKKEYPNISVILPTYNRANLLANSIQSILDQTYQNFEIIVVDDGSRDNTKEVVYKFQKRDKRIKYIRHKTNKGSAAARNTGIKTALGNYIAFQDSDDTWEPEKLEKQVSVFESVSKEVGIVYTDMWRIREGKKKYLPSPEIMPEDGIIYEQALARVMGIGIGTAMIKRICFNLTGMFDENLHRFIDLEFFIRLSKYYYFYHIKKPLINYFDSGERVSGNDNALIEAVEIILKKYYSEIEKNKKSWAKFQYRVANILCLNGNTVQWKKYLQNAIKNDPFNIKYLTAHMFSLFGSSIYNKMIQVRVWIQGFKKVRKFNSI